jgi:hypothetical protein
LKFCGQTKINSPCNQLFSQIAIYSLHLTTQARTVPQLRCAALLLPLLFVVRTVGNASGAAHTAVARAKGGDDALHDLCVRVRE